MNTHDQSLIPQFILQAEEKNKALYNILSLFAGVLGLSLLAQIYIPLSWTPVPITGQTFGVALMAHLWGRKRGVTVVLSYILIGALGFPVFAQAASGLAWGPTTGYLCGMVLASYWIGYLSDIGWTKTFLRTYLATAMGSLIIFTCGALVLSFFLPLKSVLFAGVVPFLPGDLIKSLAASSLVFYTYRKVKGN